MIYLDNAATSWPKPESVYKEMDQFIRKYGANPGRAGHQMAAEAGRRIYDVREKLADFFGANDSTEIIFTSSATHSLNLGIKGVIEKGDHVITSCLEHNSVIRPLKELERNQIIDLTVIGLNPSGQLDFDALKKETNDNTRLIAITHGSNVFGHLFDIKKIGHFAKENNILFMVDAAQTAGVFDLNVEEMNIDIMGLPGHKSLYGPPGTGILYLRKGISVRPIFEGGTGSKSETLFQPDVWPEQFESGTLNSNGIIGIGAGIDYILSEGIKKIRQHELELTTLFINSLEEIDKVHLYGPSADTFRTPVVSFNIADESSSEVGYILDKFFNIAVRTGLHCSPLAHQTLNTTEQGTVRASFGYFNTKEEVEQVINVIHEIVGKID